MSIFEQWCEKLQPSERDLLIRWCAEQMRQGEALSWRPTVFLHGTPTGQSSIVLSSQPKGK